MTLIKNVYLSKENQFCMMFSLQFKKNWILIFFFAPVIGNTNVGSKECNCDVIALTLYRCESTGYQRYRSTQGYIEQMYTCPDRRPQYCSSRLINGSVPNARVSGKKRHGLSDTQVVHSFRSKNFRTAFQIAEGLYLPQNRYIYFLRFLITGSNLQ